MFFSLVVPLMGILKRLFSSDGAVQTLFLLFPRRRLGLVNCLPNNYKPNNKIRFATVYTGENVIAKCEASDLFRWRLQFSKENGAPH